MRREEGEITVENARAELADARALYDRIAAAHQRGQTTSGAVGQRFEALGRYLFG